MKLEKSRWSRTAVLGATSLVWMIACQVNAQGTEQAWQTTYNEFGLIETADGPRVDVDDLTAYEYDAVGNLVTVTDALGHVTTYSDYDANGNARSIIDANGVETRLEYDFHGRLISSTIVAASGAGNHSTEYTYYPDGMLKSVSSSGTGQIDFEYNDANQLISVANQAGETIEYSLDAAGNRTSQRIRNSAGAIAYSVQRVYDELSRVIEIAGNAGQRDQISYDPNDNETAFENARQALSTQVYDGLNRVIKQIDPLGAESAITYDDLDRIRTVTDPNGNTTTYEYDALGNLISLSSPDTGLTRFAYDAAGNRIEAIDARGVISRFAYDALNRLTRVTYPDSPQNNITYLYDDTRNGNYGAGRLTGIQTALEDIHWTYNEFGLVTQKLVVQENGASATTRYNYAAGGLLKNVIYPSDRRVHYGRDALGRIIHISTQADRSSPAQTIAFGIKYLPFGPATAFRYGNGLSHVYTYDTDYRLEKIDIGSVNPLLGRNYFYDVTNNIISIDNAVDPDKDLSFEYDLSDRLTHAAGPYGELGYAYDDVGNRMAETRNEETLSYEYEADSNRLIGVQGADVTRDFIYDAAGNLISGTSADGDNIDYGYDASGRLTTVSVNGQPTATYRYNPLGQRTAKILATGVQEHYHYDEDGRLLAVHDGNGRVQREYLYWDDKQVALAAVPEAGAAGKVPGRVEAEDFTDARDTTPGNSGDSDCATGDVDSQRTTDATGHCHLAWTRAGEWTEYSVNNDTAGTFSITLRAASAAQDRVVRLQLNGEDLSEPIIISGTSWNQFKDYSIEASIPAGSSTLRMVFDTGSVNVNYLDIARVGEDAEPTATQPQTAALYFIHHDHLNTPQMLTNQSQQIAWKADYEPFGKTTNITTNGLMHLSRFPGQYEDPETGLYYNYFRDYDPSLGRYVQSDPIGLAGGINTYAYVENNPLSYVDPHGLNPAAGVVGGFFVGGPPGAVIGGVIGAGIGIWGAKEAWNHYNESSNGTQCPVDKDQPPNHPDFKPDKKKKGREKIPWNKNRRGYKDRKGNYWEPVPDGHKGTHEPHWDIQHPDGSHTPVYPIKWY